MNDKCVEDKCMNDNGLILPSVSKVLRRQDFNTEKIRTTKRGMKNCGKLRQKCCR